MYDVLKYCIMIHIMMMPTTKRAVVGTYLLTYLVVGTYPGNYRVQQCAVSTQ